MYRSQHVCWHISSHLHTHAQPQTRGCITEGFLFCFVSTCWYGVLYTEVPLQIRHRVFYGIGRYSFTFQEILSVITKVDLSRVLKCSCAMWWKYFYIKGL